MKRILVVLVVISGFVSVVLSVHDDVRKQFCGQRLSGYRKLNRTVKTGFDVETFSSDEDTFPWMVSIRMRDGSVNGTLLCAGVAVSPYVAMTSAHCLVGVQKSRLKIQDFGVENVIIHPDYVQGHPSHTHDLALVKIRESGTAGFQMFACLPEEGDDPVDDCQVADFIEHENALRILAHDIEFGPSVQCAEETPHLRGYLDNPDVILCSENVEPCSRFVTGPVFCPGGDSSNYALVGLSTDATNWCSVGAYTRLAKYSQWIIKGIRYLEGEPIFQRHQHSKNSGADDDGNYFQTAYNFRMPCTKGIHHRVFFFAKSQFLILQTSHKISHYSRYVSIIIDVTFWWLDDLFTFRKWFEYGWRNQQATMRIKFLWGKRSLLEFRRWLHVLVFETRLPKGKSIQKLPWMPLRSTLQSGVSYWFLRVFVSYFFFFRELLYLLSNGHGPSTCISMQ